MQCVILRCLLIPLCTNNIRYFLHSSLPVLLSHFIPVSKHSFLFHVSSLVRQPWYIKTHLTVTSQLLFSTYIRAYASVIRIAHAYEVKYCCERTCLPRRVKSCRGMIGVRGKSWRRLGRRVQRRPRSMKREGKHNLEMVIMYLFNYHFALVMYSGETT